MKLKIDPEFSSFIPPLSDEERTSLERSIVLAGRAREPIDTWRGTIVDGHNRYEICTRLGLPFTTRELPFDDRVQVKAWMFEYQIARRNLSKDQIIMLAAMRGIPSERGSPEQRRRAAELVAAGKGANVLSGHRTLQQAYNDTQPARKRAPRGPSAKPHYIPEGHVLTGVSTLTGADGEPCSMWTKTGLAGADEPPHDPIPEGHHVTSTSTMYRGDGTTTVQWVTAKADEIAREKAVLEAWARHAKLYAGLAGTCAAPSADAPAEMLTVIPLGDPHIGMLSWAPETGDHFDATIACRELLACVRLLVNAAEPSHKCIITNLGDFFHAQDDAAVTPGHGHRLDVDGRFAKVLDMGHTLMRGIVDAALVKFPLVAVRNLPGNHDPRVASELYMWLQAVYEQEPRVIAEPPFRAHQYDRHGSVLIGWHHGDTTKPVELPALMATDRPADWGATRERVWHTGHIHHLVRKETPGCVVESHRTLAGADAWHAGRYRAGRSLVAIGYHAEYGEVSRATVNLARTRAALKSGGIA